MGTPLKIKKPMSRDEVALLVDLVVKRPAITTKETNAATNKLKEDAWNSLAVEFNEISDQPRSKEQIKLKWDNLKKAARKKVSQSDKEETEMVPLGDILDRVSDLLGYTKPDAPPGDWIVVDSIGESYSSTAKKRKSENSTEESFIIDKYKKRLESFTGQKDSSGARERNLAIARYYEKRTEKTELEIKLLKAQINKQCACNNRCELNSDGDNKTRNIIDKIKQLNSKINSDRIKRDRSNIDNRFNNSDDDSNNVNNNQFNNSDGKEICIDIVKCEVESP